MGAVGWIQLPDGDQFLHIKILVSFPVEWLEDNVTFFVSTTTLILTTKQVSIPIN